MVGNRNSIRKKWLFLSSDIIFVIIKCILNVFTEANVKVTFWKITLFISKVFVTNSIKTERPVVFQNITMQWKFCFKEFNSIEKISRLSE